MFLNSGDPFNLGWFLDVTSIPRTTPPQHSTVGSKRMACRACPSPPAAQCHLHYISLEQLPSLETEGLQLARTWRRLRKCDTERQGLSFPLSKTLLVLLGSGTPAGVMGDCMLMKRIGAGN